jgi:hypothetical protein
MGSSNSGRDEFLKHLEDELGNKLVGWFSRIGGDHQSAVRAAVGYTTSGWIDDHKMKVGASGFLEGTAAGAFSLVPGVGWGPAAATIAGGTIYLLNQAARCSWGVGSIKNCHVFPKVDLARILAAWVDADSTQLSAVSNRTFSLLDATVCLLDHVNDIDDLTKKSKREGILSPGDEEAFVYALANSFADGRDLQSITRDIARGTASTGTVSAIKAGTKVAAKYAPKLAVKGFAKLAPKIAAKIAAKYAAKFGAGAIPGVGVILGGGISTAVNVWIMDGISKQAVKYYDNAI